MPLILDDLRRFLQVDSLKIEPLRPIEFNHVWKVSVADDQIFFLKRHIIPICFYTEIEVLKFLKSDRCAVPKCEWFDEKDLLILTEWCGDQTLDDLAQKSATDDLKNLVVEIVEAYRQIELSFANQMYRYTFGDPMICEIDPKIAIENALQIAKQMLKHLLQNRKTEIDYYWRSISDLLLSSSWTLGSTDINARNIVLDRDQKPKFVDLGNIGFDATAKRIVQYLNSLGADRDDGSFVSLLDPRIGDKISELWRSNLLKCEIDAHQMLSDLLLINRLLKNISQNRNTENLENLRKRYNQLIDRLKNNRLSDHVAINRIRDLMID